MLNGPERFAFDVYDGWRLGTVAMIETIATATIPTLNISAIAAANRTLTLSFLPIAISANGANPFNRLNPAKSAAEIATPRAAPSDDAIL